MRRPPCETRFFSEKQWSTIDKNMGASDRAESTGHHRSIRAHAFFIHMGYSGISEFIVVMLR